MLPKVPEMLQRYLPRPFWTRGRRPNAYLADYELAATGLHRLGGCCNGLAISHDFNRLLWRRLQWIGEGFPLIAYYVPTNLTSEPMGCSQLPQSFWFSFALFFGHCTSACSAHSANKSFVTLWTTKLTLGPVLLRDPWGSSSRSRACLINPRRP
jgi:hypothetical protein